MLQPVCPVEADLVEAETLLFLDQSLDITILAAVVHMRVDSHRCLLGGATVFWPLAKVAFSRLPIAWISWNSGRCRKL
jgi:hypothetical protein